MQTAYSTSGPYPDAFQQTRELYTKAGERWKLQNPYLQIAPWAIYSHKGVIPNKLQNQNIMTSQEIRRLKSLPYHEQQRQYKIRMAALR